MNFNKKGLESYVLILLIVSLCLTVLIMTIFSSVLANDHENCQGFEYKILSKKKTDGGAKINIENTGNSKINFQFNGKNNLQNTLKPEDKFEFKITTNQNEIIIIPLYVDIQGKINECKGKKTTIQTNTLI